MPLTIACRRRPTRRVTGHASNTDAPPPSQVVQFPSPSVVGGYAMAATATSSSTVAPACGATAEVWEAVAVAAVTTGPGPAAPPPHAVSSAAAAIPVARA